MINDAILLNAGQVPFAHSRIDVAAELQIRMRRMQNDFYDRTQGRVDYPALRASADFADYREYSCLLQEYDLGCLKTLQQKKAFWINLYNSMVIHGIIALGVQRTVKEVPDFFGRIYYRIGVADYSADDIEHGILRGNRRPPYGFFLPFAEDDLRWQYRVESLDPRLHFALVCGSSSCPPIAYYTAEELDAQLELAATNFINGPEVEVLPAQNRLKLSPLFKWYRNDFYGEEGVVETLVRYRKNSEELVFLRQAGTGARVEWKGYNWALNS
jgi:hypothetical protein